jgi:hypothetical protein
MDFWLLSSRVALPRYSHFNMYGVTSVDAAPTTRRGLRCDGPLKKLNMRRSSTCVCMHMNMDMAAGFSFPDRRHYFYSGVYPGVWRRSTWSVRGRHTKMNWTPDFHFLIVVTPFIQECIQECACHLGLISCPPSLPFLRSVSRSAPSFCPSNF